MFQVRGRSIHEKAACNPPPADCCGADSVIDHLDRYAVLPDADDHGCLLFAIDHRTLCPHGVCGADIAGPCRFFCHWRLSFGRADHPQSYALWGREWLVRLLDAGGLLQSGKDMYGADLLVVWPWAAAIFAVLIAALIAVLIGIPVLKLKGHYLAMATLGFGIIIYRLVLATPWFGEADGISGVPPFELLPGLVVRGDISGRVQNYYIAWGMLIFGLFLLLNLIHSRIGRALRAIHGSEDAADAMGVNISRFKLQTFVLSAVFAAIAGILLTHFNGGIGPSEAGVMKSVRYVAIVAVGGMAHLWGALIMGVLLNFLSLRGVFGSYDDAVFGLILILIMLFAPNGILTLLPRKKEQAPMQAAPKDEEA